MSRQCYFVPEDAYEPDEGYRVSVVVEGEPGHHPTGGDGVRPYYFGHDYAKAVERVDALNARMGVSKEEAERIVNSSIAASIGAVS